MHLFGVKTVTNYLYEAFGLVLNSEYPIAQLLPAPAEASADVYIRSADLSSYGVAESHYRLNPMELIICLEQVGTFRITNGTHVEVHSDPQCTPSNLAVYIMGTCMGAILHQRGFMPLHGSCVTDGTGAILITGDSGAGKSTLAAEFLSQGWKLLTDDVCAVSDPENCPTVHSSYPSQKLWQDSLDQYKRPESDIHSLYFSETREKFGVDTSKFFLNGTHPLQMIVYLVPTDNPCSITKIDTFTALDQLMNNTYRIFMIQPEHRQRHFQRCAALAEKIPMVLLTRQNNLQSAHELYQLITNFLKTTMN